MTPAASSLQHAATSHAMTHWFTFFYTSLCVLCAPLCFVYIGGPIAGACWCVWAFPAGERVAAAPHCARVAVTGDGGAPTQGVVPKVDSPFCRSSIYILFFIAVSDFDLSLRLKSLPWLICSALRSRALCDDEETDIVLYFLFFFV